MIPEVEKQKPILVSKLERAEFTVYRPADGLYVTVANGHVLESTAKDFIAFLEGEMKRGVSNMSFFHDWWELDTYEQSARQRLTEWRRAAPRGTTKDSHVLVRSKLLAMGVAASAIVLRMVGVEMRAHTDRAAFERALRDAIRHRSAS
ncbi:MAG: hypothetical protein JNK05_25030 [Myxococcales bacterium]|nr:hypothetical protein [Myxococcales bacterium]